MLATLLGARAESSCKVMSPMEVEIKTRGPVMGGLVGAGATAWGVGAAASAGGGAAAGGGWVFASCAKAAVAERQRARARRVWRMSQLKQKGRETSRPAALVFVSRCRVEADSNGG